MFTSNAFAAVSGSLPAGFMQWFVGLMILAVILGTLLDVIHKGSATYFFANWRKTKEKGAPVDVASIAVKTVVVDVLASGEFCNQRRRVAHLLTMYGFVIYLVTTLLMVYAYPTAATPTPALVAQLWWLGGLMALAGGYWFWFFIRVDVAAEGGKPLRVMRADLFILSL
ncbi:MAG TPA: adenylyl-sulfate reductase, partial [Usitatibacteraceae bacterium]|nr:adenylyl-sulfate reductase [Usitatibacteraceae bacterium]